MADAIYKNIKQLEAVFRLMDVDDSGALSMDEFTQACEVINRVSEGAAVLSTEQIQEYSEVLLGWAVLCVMYDWSQAFNLFDKNKDGVLVFEEFVNCFEHVTKQ